MDEGHRLCRRCSDLATSASSHAQQSEDAIIRSFAHAEEFESSAVEFARFAEKTSQLSSHVVTQVQGLTAQINEITSSIASVMQDPG